MVGRGHHLFRYYVTGDTDLDNRFLTEMKDRYGDRVRLKSIDMSLKFTEWDTALSYAEKIRHHDPIHFEHPSRSMHVNAEFTRRWDLPVSLHIETLEQAHEAIELRAGTAFNLACVHWGPTYLRRIAAAAEAAAAEARRRRHHRRHRHRRRPTHHPLLPLLHRVHGTLGSQ